MRTATGLMLAATLINFWAVPSLAQSGFGPIYGMPSQSGRNCRTDDLSCRVQALEQRVTELETRGTSGGSNGDRGRRGRSVDMSVDRDCIFDSCAVLATNLCVNAGFARGVPIEVRPSGSYQRLVRASCLD